MERSWEQLLEGALTEPGRVSEAYQAFHDYSLGNQLLALWQCTERGLPVGPLTTYKGWQEKGRQVRRGERALTLCMPVSWKKEGEGEEEEKTVTVYRYYPRWFVLSQTDGEEFKLPEVPDWAPARALESFNLRLVPFTQADGNTQGYSKPAEKSLAINPLAAFPLKTLVHEIAHCLLHEESSEDGGKLPQDVRELEAEGVAYLVMAALGQDGLAEARGYMQSWFGKGALPTGAAKRILQTAERVLKGGRGPG